MKLLNTMLSRVTNPARFALLHVTQQDCLIIPKNEQARDAMGSVYSTTKSVVATDNSRKALIRECGRKAMGHCGAVFFDQYMGE